MVLGAPLGWTVRFSFLCRCRVKPTQQTIPIKETVSPFTLPGGCKRGVSLEDDMRMGGLRVLESDLPLRSGIRAGIP